MEHKSWEIFDNFIDGVLIFDEARHLLYANQAMAKIIDCTLKKLKSGTKITEYLTISNTDFFFMDGGTEGKDSPGKYKEVDFKSFKGKTGKMLVMIRPYLPDDQDDPTYLCTFRDMSLEVQLQEKFNAELLEKNAGNIELRKVQKEMKQHSKNLELMVHNRTKELQQATQFVTAMVNSLEQGVLVFDKEGNCLPNFTKAVEDIFQISPEGKKIWDIIQTDDFPPDVFKTWADGIFQDIIPFKDYAALGPQKILKQERLIKIDYYPMRGDDDSLEGVVTVATDKTTQYTAELEARRNRDYVQMVLKLIKNKEQFLIFVSDSKRLMDEIKGSIAKLMKGENKLNDLLRHLHSIKGGAGIFSIFEVQTLAHKYESELATYKDKSLIDLKDYLPTLENNIQNLQSKLNDFYQECSAFLGKAVIDGEMRVEITRKKLKYITEKIGLETLDAKVRAEIEDVFFKEPIFKFFTSYSDLLSTLAADQGKQIYPLAFEGGELPIHGEKYAKLFSTLVHAFTNAMDHGIEEPELRREMGKDPKGKINVRFQRLVSGPKTFLQIDIQDDGKGINPAFIRQQLKERKIITDDTDLSDHQIIQYIFTAHFSTKAQVSNTSGRGVGANAIKTQVESMGGMIEITSFSGKGSLLSILVPEQ